MRGGYSEARIYEARDRRTEMGVARWIAAWIANCHFTGTAKGKAYFM